MREIIKKIFGEGGILAGKLPGYECRSSQLEMALAVTEALMKEVPLLIEAPTGIGKTLAYLIPAIMSNKKIIVSTGTKNLQDQIIEKDIPFLIRHFKHDLDVVSLKGRRNYVCKRRFELLMRDPKIITIGLQPELKKLSKWLKKTATGDRAEIDWLPDESILWQEISSGPEQCVGSECDYYTRCFITRLKQHAAAADLVLVNHYLYFADLSLRQGEYGAVLPNHQAVMFDEAHQLDGVSTQYFGIEMSVFRFLDLIHDIKREMMVTKITSKDLTNQLSALETSARVFFDTFPKTTTRIRIDNAEEFKNLAEFSSNLFRSLKNLSSALIPFENVTPAFSNFQIRIKLLESALQLILSKKDPEMVYWYETRVRGTFLHATPINVSEYLRDLLFSKIRPVIMTSATLAIGKDFSYVKQCLGVPDEAGEIVLPSHFPYEKNLLIFAPRKFPLPSSPEFVDTLERGISTILSLSKGRALVLFTSHKNMQKIYKRLQSRNFPFRLLVQGEKPKRTLLNLFKDDVHSVLLATGSFWEGVDVPGPALSAVIIDKLPFEVPSDPVLAARLEKIREEGKDPFWHYQVPQAILSLKQGVGRLIRTVDDRGVVAIFDTRLWQKSYGKKFFESLPPGKITWKTENIEAFFSN